MDPADIAKQYFQLHKELTVPVEEIVQQIQGGNSRDWHRGIDIARRMATDQEALSQDVSTALGSLESVWQGDAANQVSARLQKVRASMLDAHQTFLDNGGTHTTATTLYDNLRNQITQMPAKPDLAPAAGKSWYEYDHMWQLVEYTAAADESLQQYQEFTNQTQGNTGRLKSDYGQIGAYDGGDVRIERQPDAQHQPAASKPGGSVPGNAHRGVTGGHLPGIGTSAGHPGGPAGPGGPDGVNGPGAPGGTSGSNPTHGPGSDHTTTAGYQPSPVQPGLAPPSWGGYQPGTGGSGTQGFGPGGFGTGELGAGAGGFGPGTTPFGTGGATSGPGEGPATRSPGNSSGTGARTGAGEPGARTGSMRGGAAGERGLPGAGAAGGRGGKKEEDAEHDRKYVLDTDDIFTDEDLVDPVTGLRSAPPTLGA
ncbi:hypothetical protein ATK36_3126 [Amycolatopsis sulphurea]|uniref:PPE family protein n=1 Tax=Amycolatopsis sulphurea TaxID=76022 RepID=A0A2A9FBX1_9PSEU|nr:hypothetical protein [Amycolatopsis sulphurea]PFG48052.1 hypothetical protein ATK36_3126 [Amycolatopsis sulphurea]